MSYRKLLQTVLQYDPNDIQVLTNLLQSTVDLRDPQVIDVAQKLHDFEQVYLEINGLSPGDRTMLLSRIERIAACEKITLSAYIDPGSVPSALIQPYFVRRDIVWCHFGGVGTETDLHHLALVWHDNPLMDDITVIPTTSQYAKEYLGVFNAGRVSGLPPRDTILQVNKMSNISRKRVNMVGGKYVQGTLHHGYVDRIRHAVAILYGGEESLDDIVRNRLGERFGNRHAIRLPRDLRAFESKRFWAIRELNFDPSTNILHFRKYNETVMQSIELVTPKTTQPINFKIRNGIYDDIYGGDPNLRATAFANFNLHY